MRGNKSSLNDEVAEVSRVSSREGDLKWPWKALVEATGKHEASEVDSVRIEEE